MITVHQNLIFFRTVGSEGRLCDCYCAVNKKKKRKKNYCYCAALKYMINQKEILNSFPITSTEDEKDTRIHGTIYANHKKGKKGKVLEATRP